MRTRRVNPERITKTSNSFAKPLIDLSKICNNKEKRFSETDLIAPENRVLFFGQTLPEFSPVKNYGPGRI